ncbi:MAG: cytochrome c biogenesis protein CcsA [Myxococcota bacterium]|nr:cytochrome c biogenesis protein CcsA [Myxococcota bacterium]MDW8362496.1 cytochrome c-type biogenesis CcmF C-terminal domain-containing protein [Myxococcales bacterium]
MSADLPTLGSLLLGLCLVCAGWSVAAGIAAGRGRPHLLPAARAAQMATTALLLAAVCVLAFAFLTHDFRIRYVARYSDRSMSPLYLLAALWGGQDGSLLWWTFLVGAWGSAALLALRDRLATLQPWIAATLGAVKGFFLVLMLFAANPFSVTAGAVPPDGEGLNPLLQNYWMLVHPPALYLGFTGWTVPFAFGVAALVSGQVGNEWLAAARRWWMAAWLALSIGLLLGMIWSYEELGWGGYWAWDPVENASFMPWLTATAFLHSVVIQERYGMMRVWNVFLLFLTYLLTIFGTFLTRSGLIASVHSFARSDLGIYFVVFMILLLVGCGALLVWRLPLLRARHRFESLLSREFAFLFNNWILLAMMLAVLALTTLPLLSEWLRGETVTVGPPVYNYWMVPFGLVLLFLTGYGPIVSWRKATGRHLVRALAVPVGVATGVGVLHGTLGPSLGFPPLVRSESIYETATGEVLAALYAVAPVAASTLVAFVLAAVVQEFVRGVRARMRTHAEGPLAALAGLLGRARRRYGGYVVHAGIALMYLGFTGAAYDVERERALPPGGSVQVGRTHGPSHELRYERPRMERDPNKRALYADLVLERDGQAADRLSPAKFIYRTHPQMPTTEVAVRSRPLEDLYVIMSTVDPQSRIATFRVLVRPLVFWIWVGGALLVLGTVIAVWPSARELLETRTAARAPGSPAGRLVATRAGLALLGLGVVATLLGVVVATARAQDSSSLHAGTVEIRDPQERRLFERLLCMCGECARLSLATCGCSWAEEARAEVRARMAAGASAEEIEADYRARYGAAAIAIPPDEGLGRAAWAIPVGAGLLAAAGIVWLGLRWRRRGRGAEGAAQETQPAPDAAARARSDAEYDARIDEELRRLEGS